MSLYNHHVPFTSNLNMWSPSPSITAIHNATTVTPTTNFNYHHEPVYYPSACIICGLPHHPVPHTLMQQQDNHDVVNMLPAAILATPAPSESIQPTPPKCIKKTRNRRFSISRQHRNNSKTYKTLVSTIRQIAIKFVRMMTVVLKAPPNIRRHNIYPIINREDSNNKLD